MPSGVFHSVEISSITIDREGRQRREITDIESLSASIRANGLINPILIRRDHQLVAGERRLTACKALGWTHINVQYEDEVDPLILKVLELEENIRRVDLLWLDRSLAINSYHELRSKADPAWSSEATAKALNLSPATISDNLGVAKAHLSGDQKVAKAEKFSVAANIVRRTRERAAADEMENILSDLSGTVPAEPAPTAEGPIIIADFNEWAPAYVGPRFNFIHCDFPYGINADKFKQGSATAFGGYSDTRDVYFKLLQTLADNINRVAADSCHLMFWFSMDYYQITLDFLTDRVGLAVNPFPLIWFKSDNSGPLPDPSRGPRRVYETCFLASRGDRKIISAKANVAPAAVTKEIHSTEKAPEMLRHFFSMFVDTNTKMLDPTAGSGNALRVASKMGAAVTGLELNPEFADLANKAFIRECL